MGAAAIVVMDTTRGLGRRAKAWSDLRVRLGAFAVLSRCMICSFPFGGAPAVGARWRPLPPVEGVASRALMGFLLFSQVCAPHACFVPQGLFHALFCWWSPFTKQS